MSLDIEAEQYVMFLLSSLTFSPQRQHAAKLPGVFKSTFPSYRKHCTWIVLCVRCFRTMFPISFDRELFPNRANYRELFFISKGPTSFDLYWRRCRFCTERRFTDNVCWNNGGWNHRVDWEIRIWWIWLGYWTFHRFVFVLRFEYLLRFCCCCAVQYIVCFIVYWSAPELFWPIMLQLTANKLQWMLHAPLVVGRAQWFTETRNFRCSILFFESGALFVIKCACGRQKQKKSSSIPRIPVTYVMKFQFFGRFRKKFLIDRFNMVADMGPV